MKKALMKVLLIAMTLVTLLTVIPLSANATSDNKTTIFSYLTKEMGLNSAAACGIMANIEKESNFKPEKIIRDSNGLPSGGLCMWNGSRLNRLKNYCNNNGLNYLSVKGQLSYLEYELGLSQYKHVLNYLKNVPNSSSGAYDAAYYWCYYFEIPASRGSRSVQRANAAIRTYWPTYGNKKITKPEISLASEKTAYDLNSSFNIKWTSGGSDADTYRLYVAEKNQKTGKYDWTNAKIYTTSSLSQKIKSAYLGSGDYAAYVRAKNSPTAIYKDSDKIKFTIKCIDHEYTSKLLVTPTLTKEGKEELTCSVCNYKKTAAIPALTNETLGDYPMTAPSVKSLTANSITLKWDVYEGATGYYVYVREGNKWNVVGTVTGATEYTVTGLESATVYKFALRAFVKADGKIYKTYCGESYTVSTPTMPVEITSLDCTVTMSGLNTDVKGTLEWTKEKDAYAYVIYRSTDGKAFKKIAVIRDIDNTSYEINDMKLNHLYYYSVRTVVPSGNGEGYVYSAYSEYKSIIPDLSDLLNK